MKARESRPPERATNDPASSRVDADSTAPARPLRVRRTASLRCEPLTCGSRDPWAFPVEPGPSTYSLTNSERRAEANRLYGLRWGLHEITAVLDIAPRPRAVAA